MKTNMGQGDKAIRLILAAIIMVCYFLELISGTTAIVLIIIGAVFTLTSLVSFCPLYAIFGINTCKTKQAK